MRQSIVQRSERDQRNSILTAFADSDQRKDIADSQATTTPTLLIAVLLIYLNALRGWQF